MVFVAGGALAAYLCVKAFIPVDPTSERRMAVQTFRRRDPALTYLMAVRAIADSLQRRVGGREFAR